MLICEPILINLSVFKNPWFIFYFLLDLFEIIFVIDLQSS